jgi:ABC-2 type transport system permease protein
MQRQNMRDFFCVGISLRNKFVGHAVLIGFFALIPILYRYGIENRLYLFGEVTPYTYSDMNGYGHFVPGLFWSICYWLFAGALLGVLSMVFSRRGADLSWSARFKLARPRFVRLLPVASLFFFLWAGCGAWFYYNAHILNEFRTSEENRHRVVCWPTRSDNGYVKCDDGFSLRLRSGWS